MTSPNGQSASYTYADTDSTHRVNAGGTQIDEGILGVYAQTSPSGTTGFVRDPQGGLLAMQTPTGGLDYYTTDQLGSTLLLTDTTGAVAARYTYDPFGNTTTNTGPDATLNPYRYVNGYTGLPPRFRTRALIGSDPEWRIENARTA